MLHSGGGSNSQNPILKTVGIIVQSGWSGVTLFFILSGFLITGILWDSRHSEHWLRNFYIRRLLRIFPLYYGSLILVVLAGFVVHNGLSSFSGIWAFALYLQNIPYITAVAGVIRSPLRLSHFWSLAVEEQFYLIWPFLLYRLRNLRDLKRLSLATFLISCAFRLIRQKYFPEAAGWNDFTLARAAELATGAFLAACYRDDSWQILDRFAPLTAGLSFTAFAIAGMVQGNLHLYSDPVLTFGLPAITLFFASLLVLALRHDGPLSHAMKTRWLRWVGSISYGLYVIHVLITPIYPIVSHWVRPNAGRSEMLALNGIFTLLISFPLAWLSFRFYETPFLNLRKKFSATTPSTKPQPVIEVT